MDTRTEIHSRRGVGGTIDLLIGQMIKNHNWAVKLGDSFIWIIKDRNFEVVYQKTLLYWSW